VSINMVQRWSPYGDQSPIEPAGRLPLLAKAVRFPGCNGQFVGGRPVDRRRSIVRAEERNHLESVAGSKRHP